ncbi:MAG: redoxin family protein [Cytophagaceae bacterium]
MKKIVFYILSSLLLLINSLVFSQSNNNSVAIKGRYKSLEGEKYCFSSDCVDQATVFVFISPACDLSENYVNTINNIKNQYGGRVNIIGVVSGGYHKKKEVRKYVKDHKLYIPVLMDMNLRLSAAFESMLSPEVVLIDKNRVLKYRGALDNETAVPDDDSGNYLIDALDAVLSDKQVAVSHTKVQGCYIHPRYFFEGGWLYK